MIDSHGIDVTIATMATRKNKICAGRPRVSGDRQMIRVTPQFMSMVDDFRRRQEKIPSFSQAVNSMVSGFYERYTKSK